MNKIAPEIRRKIFDNIILSKIPWNGEMEEPDFLARVFDISNMYSKDSRFHNAYLDTWQHRVNNPTDWDDDYVLYDDRFNLIYIDDSVFIKFILETLHPRVRKNKDELKTLLNIYNENLINSNLEINEVGELYGLPLFDIKESGQKNSIISNRNKSITNYLSQEYVSKQIGLMEKSIDDNPAVAIGISKELVETICKSILTEKEIEYDRNEELPKLLRTTMKELKLVPEGISNELKGSESIKKILGSLITVVFGISELRNEYGSGHGKEQTFKGLSPRHARLTTGASATLATFLLETHEYRKNT